MSIVTIGARRTSSYQMDDATRTFERLRPRLMGIAYRLLGSTREAEAVLRDVSSRWRQVASAQQDRAEAWLMFTVAHVGLSRLPKQKEVSGQLIPDAAPVTPDQMRERADELSVTFLTAMEDLPPETRTAFLLCEMFDVELKMLAQIVGKSEAECRQMVQTARTWLRERRPRSASSGDPRFRLLSRFAQAVATVDLSTLTGILSDSAELNGDGGGKVLPFNSPTYGGKVIARLLVAAALRYGSELSIEIAPVEGQWALLFHVDGVLDSVHSYKIDEERIVRLEVRRATAS